MIVDAVRSCYSVNMIFAPGGPPVLVDWFFTEPKAEVFTGPNLFNSRNWEDDRGQVFDLGEQPGTRPWRNGQKPAGLVGRGNCGDALLFESGQSGPFSPARSATIQGVPACCLRCPKAVINPPSAPTTAYMQGCGGLLIGGQSLNNGKRVTGCWHNFAAMKGTFTHPVAPFVILSVVGFKHWQGFDVPGNFFDADCGGPSGRARCRVFDPGPAAFVDVGPLISMVVGPAFDFAQAVFVWTLPFGYPLGTLLTLTQPF
jgi:hypothetical protein